jgi:competence protein ComEA
MLNQSELFISKQMRFGIFLVALICLIIIFTPRLYRIAVGDDKLEWESYAIETFDKEQKQFVVEETQKKASKKNRKFSIPPSKFNPNNYSLKDWIHLGLTEKQAAVVLKFSKYGFHSNEDLKKVFVISDEFFHLIKDSTFYEAKSFDNTRLVVQSNSDAILFKVELNVATQNELELVKGIGSFYAKNILNKRTQLGGFYCKEQLLEVWKMEEEKYLSIVNYFDVDITKINKINLNKASLEELKAHPYINWNLANNLIKMREERNGFIQLEEIKESVLISDELFVKLKHYLSL